MSGGSWDYAYSKFRDIGEQLECARDPKRRALGKLVVKISKAMHDIEWVDSGDYGTGGEVAAIDEVIGPRAELETLVEDAKTVRAQIDEVLARIEKGANP